MTTVGNHARSDRNTAPPLALSETPHVSFDLASGPYRIIDTQPSWHSAADGETWVWPNLIDNTDGWLDTSGWDGGMAARWLIFMSTDHAGGGTQGIALAYSTSMDPTDSSAWAWYDKPTDRNVIVNYEFPIVIPDRANNRLVCISHKNGLGTRQSSSFHTTTDGVNWGFTNGVELGIDWPDKSTAQGDKHTGYQGTRILAGFLAGTHLFGGGDYPQHGYSQTPDPQFRAFTDPNQLNWANFHYSLDGSLKSQPGNPLFRAGGRWWATIGRSTMTSGGTPAVSNVTGPHLVKLSSDLRRPVGVPIRLFQNGVDGAGSFWEGGLGMTSAVTRGDTIYLCGTATDGSGDKSIHITKVNGRKLGGDGVVENGLPPSDFRDAEGLKFFDPNEGRLMMPGRHHVKRSHDFLDGNLPTWLQLSGEHNSNWAKQSQSYGAGQNHQFGYACTNNNALLSIVGDTPFSALPTDASLSGMAFTVHNMRVTNANMVLRMGFRNAGLEANASWRAEFANKQNTNGSNVRTVNNGTWTQHQINWSPFGPTVTYEAKTITIVLFQETGNGDGDGEWWFMVFAHGDQCVFCRRWWTNHNSPPDPTRLVDSGAAMRPYIQIQNKSGGANGLYFSGIDVEIWRNL